MKKRSIILYLFFIFLAYGIVNASDGWQIYRNIESARPNSICTNHMFQSSLTGILYNPAQLSFLQSNSLDFTATKAEGSEQSSGGFIYANSSQTFPFALSYFSFDYGTAELSWIENDAIVSRNVSAQKDNLLGLTLARPLSAYTSCGINIKYADSSIAETASSYAIAFDAGITVKTASTMSLTIAFQNIGVTSKFLYKSDDLPSAINLGLNYFHTIRGIYLMGNVNSSYLLNEQKTTPEITIETGMWPISFFFDKKLYKNELNASFGVGICLDKYEISYSFTPSQWLGNTQKISLYYKFGYVLDSRKPLLSLNKQDIYNTKQTIKDSSKNNELDTSTFIKGGVIDVNGNPIEGAEVIVFKDDRVIQEILVKKDGKFKSIELQSGNYTISLWKAGYKITRYELTRRGYDLNYEHFYILNK